MLGVTPKGFNPVNVFRASDEFIVAVINPEMSINADVHKPTVAAPSIRVDHTVGVNFATNNGLQRSFGGIRDDLGVDAAAAQEAETEVKTKAEQATLWCKHASDYAKTVGGKPWKYLLVPHDVVAANVTLENLVARYGAGTLPLSS